MCIKEVVHVEPPNYPSIEPRMVDKFQTRSLIFCTHVNVSFWSSLRSYVLDPHLTTHHSNLSCRPRWCSTLKTSINALGMLLARYTKCSNCNGHLQYERQPLFGSIFLGHTLISKVSLQDTFKPMDIVYTYDGNL